METKEMSGIFKLKMAKSLIDDVVRAREQSKGISEKNELLADLSRAISLVKEVSLKEPHISLDDGATCEVLIAEAQFQGGLCQLGSRKWYEAQSYFLDSWNLFPTQETAYNIAVCIANTVFFKGNQARYVRGLDGKQFYYWPPFKNKKKARAAVKSAFDRVIEMDSDSELAIEAGKMLIRYKL